LAQRDGECAKERAFGEPFILGVLRGGDQKSVGEAIGEAGFDGVRGLPQR